MWSILCLEPVTLVLELPQKSGLWWPRICAISLSSLEKDSVLGFHCCEGTLTKVTLIKKTFNWDWLIVSEVQSIFIMAGSMATSRQA